MKRFFPRLKFRAIETTLMAISFYWGVILFLPLDTFSVSAAYHPMNNLAPEIVWATLMLIVSWMHCLGMLLDCRKIRRVGLMLAAGQWYFISTMLLLGSPADTAWGTYYVIATLSTWLYGKEVGKGNDE